VSNNLLNKMNVLNAQISFLINIIFKFIIIFIINYNEIFVIRLKQKSKILLCTVAKNENKYIEEFVQHYINMKVDNIFIYDNNEIDGENFDDILKNEIKNNFIKIINIRGFKTPQKRAYDHCYKYNKYNYEWVAFYDIDEFLYLSNYTYINDFLSSPLFEKCQSIIINWKYYGDNEKLFYEPKPLKERFTEPINSYENLIKDKYIYSAAKTIVRGGLFIIWAHFPHYLKNTVNCRPNGNILENYFSPPDLSYAYINHYTTKSTEEYIEKLNNGNVNENSDISFIQNKIKYYYFLINKITKQKIDLINNKLKYKINISLD
jgi:hypothetical protein